MEGKRKRATESGGAQEVVSSTGSIRMTVGDHNPIEEKGTGRDRDDPNEEKRSGMERGGAQAVASSTASRSRVALGADGRPLDGVTRGDLVPGLKHGDGSVYRIMGYWGKVYRLYDTSETCLEPMLLTVPYENCMPNWRVCERHSHSTMMQIFSLKLANPSYVGDPIELYGYVAVRDLLNPMRNYVFNHTRDDPFVVGHDSLIQMSGPKRGIRMQGTVLIEFYLKIKTGGEESDDLELIDGIAPFSDRIYGHAKVNTERLDGDCGSVDITFALLECASEATIQFGISKIDQDSGLSLCLIGSYYSPFYSSRGKIQLFDGVIAAEASELSKNVVAVEKDSQLVLTAKLRKGGRDIVCRCDMFRVEKHGSRTCTLYLGLATVDVKVTWSTMDDIPDDLLGPNCFKYDFEACKGIEWDD